LPPSTSGEKTIRLVPQPVYNDVVADMVAPSVVISNATFEEQPTYEPYYGTQGEIAATRPQIKKTTATDWFNFIFWAIGMLVSVCILIGAAVFLFFALIQFLPLWMCIAGGVACVIVGSVNLFKLMKRRQQDV
jgi:hypothetical protein